MIVKVSSDRRSHERFDIVGALWGLLELTEPAQIRNVSTTGALIDAPLPAVLESTQSMRVLVDGEPVTIDVRVRHVRRVDDINAGEAAAPRYLIGVEFLSPPESVLQSIEQLGQV